MSSQDTGATLSGRAGGLRPEPVPVSAVPALIPSADEPEWKGGYDQASWMGRYAERMMQAGFKPYEAECWAFNAWEASPEDADPDDTASDDLAYASEDSQ